MGIAAEILAMRLQLACWVLESAFCGVQMLLFFTASERGGILGKSLQLKVAQCVVAIFAVLVQVQMHGAVCGAVRGDPFQRCLRSGFAFCGVSFLLSI